MATHDPGGRSKKASAGRLFGGNAGKAEAVIEVRREAALLKTGALQNAIFNSANFSSIATDEKGVIQLFNVGAERMLGYAAADVLDKITPADISDPQEVIVRAKALSIELATPITPGFEALVFKASRGIEDIYELTYIRKDGSRFPAVVSVTALRDDQSAIIGYLLIGTDNTARKQVEADQKQLDQRLRDQQFYTRSLIESNIDALITTNPSGIITDVNKQMEALTGCTRDELIGAPFKNYFTDPERAEDGIRLVLRERTVTNYELTASSMDGRETVVSYNATTFYDRDRKLQGVFAAARDVTEQKRLEEQLRRRSEELEEQNRRVQEANRLKSEFLANMSHELRTPLNGIIGFSEILHDGKAGNVSDTQKEYLGDILTSSKHLLQLINDVLDLAKVESGKMEFSPVPVNLDKIVGEVRDVVRPLMSKKRLKIETAVTPDVASIVADPSKLKQVLYNYLSNAIKFTPDGGQIAVRIGPDGPGSFRLEVEDTGIGIKPEDIGRLFVEFQQLDAGTAKQYPGTGLGLALSRRIVEAMGGSVGVRSVMGKGSVFFAVIPRAPLVAVKPETAKVPSQPAGPRILVIEDDMEDRNYLLMTLGGAGYAVETVTNGSDAIERCGERAFDGITLDMLLPDMYGRDVLKTIRSQGLNRDTPVIVVTVLSDKGLAAGFAVQEILVKPIRPNELLAALERTGITDGTQSILVVDDDAKDLKLAEKVLRDQGYRALCRADVRGALEAAAKELPAAVILDLMMPEQEGFDFLSRFREIPKARRVPVIVWTGKDLSKTERRKLESSAQGIVLKGQGPTTLLTELKTHVVKKPSAAGPVEAQHAG
jgi:PAS domain S-box-containing protein